MLLLFRSGRSTFPSATPPPTFTTIFNEYGVDVSEYGINVNEYRIDGIVRSSVWASQVLAHL